MKKLVLWLIPPILVFAVLVALFPIHQTRPLAAQGLQRGTGFRVVSGAQTRWRPFGAALFNPGYDPFDAPGALAVSRFGPEWAGRYTGGDLEATKATPIAGAEWEPHAGAALQLWCQAGGPEADLPANAYRSPGAWDCAITDRERVDLIYLADSISFIARWVWEKAGDPAGKTPPQPLVVNRPDIPFRYFAEKHVLYPGVLVYFRNDARPAAEVSYSKNPRYPQVFGPPSSSSMPEEPGPGGPPVEPTSPPAAPSLHICGQPPLEGEPGPIVTPAPSGWYYRPGVLSAGRVAIEVPTGKLGLELRPCRMP